MITLTHGKSAIATAYKSGRFSPSFWYKNSTDILLSNGQVKQATQSHFTPGGHSTSSWALAYNQIKSQIWDKDIKYSRVCVFFQVEWVLLLIEDFGCIPSNIVFFSDNQVKSSLASTYGAQVITSMCDQDKTAIGKLLNMEKVQLVLKNPPWDNGIDVGIKLPYRKYQAYSAFTFIGQEILEDGGICIDVLPTNFMSMPTASEYRNWILNNFEVMNISIWDNSKHEVFEGITMSDVVTMVTRKKSNPNNKSVEWISYDGVPFTVDLTKYDFWPIYKSPLSVAIFDSVMSRKISNIPAFNGGSNPNQITPTVPWFMSGNLARLGARQNPYPRRNNNFQKQVMLPIKAPMWLGYSSQQELDFQFDWMDTNHYAYVFSMIQCSPLNQPILFSYMGEHNFQNCDFDKHFGVTPRQATEINEWHNSIK